MRDDLVHPRYQVSSSVQLNYLTAFDLVQYFYGTLPRSRSSRWPRGRTGKAGGHPAHHLLLADHPDALSAFSTFRVIVKDSFIYQKYRPIVT